MISYILRRLKIIFINLIVFFMLIVGIEIFVQLKFAITNGKVFLFESSPLTACRKLFEIHPYLAGELKSSVKVREGNKTITTTEHHTRWTGAADEDSNLIRIAVIGGSTAFGTGVADEDSWPALLQAKLGKQYAVINYGVPGYSTAEAIIQLALIVPEKKPHIIIFYEGWNDIRNYHTKNLRSDYYGHGMEQYEHLGLSQKSNLLFWLDNTFLTFRYLFEISNKKSQCEDALFDTPDSGVDRIYIRNLSTLKTLSGRFNAFPIFIPQVLNYELYKTEDIADSWTRHIRGKAMPILMDRFNSHMNDLCLSSDKKCRVINEVLTEKWFPEDFVDHGHLSKKGGLKLVKIISRFIEKYFFSD